MTDIYRQGHCLTWNIYNIWYNYYTIYGFTLFKPPSQLDEDMSNCPSGTLLWDLEDREWLENEVLKMERRSRKATLSDSQRFGLGHAIQMCHKCLLFGILIDLEQVLGFLCGVACTKRKMITPIRKSRPIAVWSLLIVYFIKAYSIVLGDTYTLRSRDG